MKKKYKIKPGERVVVLTGAGISAESGIKTFRDSDGLWKNHKIEEVASMDGFRANPELVWEFYKLRFHQLAEVKPNPAHYALVKLENHVPDTFTLITQNVDGLHWVAGNENVLEMHGSLKRCICSDCREEFRTREVDLTKKVPECPECRGYLRPDIIWFGEEPYYLYEIMREVEICNYLIVVGTSGIVYPAAGLLEKAKECGATTIGVNLQKPENIANIDEFHEGKAGIILPELVAQLTGVKE